MDTTSKAVVLSCQKCGAPVPYEVGYTPWCDKCGWNLTHNLPEIPATARGVAGLVNRLSRKISSHSAQQLYEEQTSGTLPPAVRVNWPLICAYVIAGLVYALVLAIVAFGVWLTVKYYWLFFVGIVCLLIGWFSRPRLGRIPKDALPRGEYKKVYALVDRIAQAVGAAPARAIVVDTAFNATVRQVGYRRLNMLVLGLPLIIALERQEFVALVAHELAHTINGDPNRGMLLGRALDLLGEWYRLLHHGFVDVTDPDETVRVGCAIFWLQYLMKIASVIPYLFAFILVHLLWHDSQRAEYRADKLAAQVSGTDAFTSMLRKVRNDEPYHFIARDVALGWEVKRGDVFTELRAYFAHITEREMERLRKVSELYESIYPDTTHPNMERRIGALQAHRSITAKVVCGQAEYEGLLQELRTLEPDMQKTIVRAHLTLGEFYRMQGSI